MTDVTNILNRIEDGDPSATEQLLPLVYDELRKLAAVRMADERDDHTLQGTALVHEAYLRLVDTSNPQMWNSRGHFFSAAAEAMRRILVDQARHKKSQRAGGDHQRIELDQIEVPQSLPDDGIIALHESLTRFQQLEPVAAELVKLRYFAGMTVPQAAEILEISTSTADRYWAYARAWLHTELKTTGDSENLNKII